MITESQLTAELFFWNNLSFTLCLNTILDSNGLDVSNPRHKPQILAFEKNYIAISYIIFHRLPYIFV